MDHRLLFMVAVLIVFVLVIGVPANGQEISGVSYSGTCGDFRVMISASGLFDLSNESSAQNEECWDVKVEVPGRFFDVVLNDWRSTHYYMNDVMCYPEPEISVLIRLSTIEPVVDGIAKLRQGNTIIEKAFNIEQECPQPLGWEWVLIIAVIVIVFFGYLLVWWWRRK